MLIAGDGFSRREFDLTSVEWECCALLAARLEPFTNVAMRIQGDKEPTLQQVVPCIAYLESVTADWNSPAEEERASADERQALLILKPATTAMLLDFCARILPRRDIDFVSFAFSVGFVQETYSAATKTAMREFVTAFYKNHPSAVGDALDNKREPAEDAAAAVPSAAAAAAPAVEAFVV